MNTRHLTVLLGATLLFGVGGVNVSSAQEEETGATASDTSPAKDSPSPKTNVSTEANAVTKTSDGRLVGLVGRFIGDQREIWTSPRRFRFSDTEWLVPFSGLTAGLLVTDREFSRHLSHNPTTISHYKSLSNAGLAALVGGAGGMWVMGHVSHNEHWSETGFLAGEAALNSLVAVEPFKYMLRRGRYVLSVRTRRRGMVGGGCSRSRIPRPFYQNHGVWPGLFGECLARQGESALSIGCAGWQPHWESRRTKYLSQASRF